MPRWTASRTLEIPPATGGLQPRGSNFSIITASLVRSPTGIEVVTYFNSFASPQSILLQVRALPRVRRLTYDATHDHPHAQPSLIQHVKDRNYFVAAKAILAPVHARTVPAARHRLLPVQVTQSYTIDEPELLSEQRLACSMAVAFSAALFDFDSEGRYCWRQCVPSQSATTPR